MERFAEADQPARKDAQAETDRPGAASSASAVHIDAGTSFNADLVQPLDFGTEVVNAEVLTDIGTPPPTGSVVHARLVSALSSATAKKGDPVEALITEPLLVDGLKTGGHAACISLENAVCRLDRFSPMPKMQETLLPGRS